MQKLFNIAIVGATGVVGETLVQILEERAFPVKTLSLLASERSVGQTLLFRNKPIEVENLADFDFSDTHIAFFSAGAEVSAEYAEQAAAAGAVVIDNTSHFRRDEDVPLVVTEVNPHAISQYTQRNIIANPNCSTMQMLVALKPLYDVFGIKRITVATYQSVSGTGKEAVSELVSQTGELLNGRSVKPKVYPVQIAFNVLPQAGVFLENGYTQEEMKLVWETHKILEDDSIEVNPTAVRVPVLFGHSEAINIETDAPITADEARAILKKAPGVKVIDTAKPGGYPTAFTHAAGTDAVYVGRIREDLTRSNGLNLWIVSDNIRKGAALNSIQIAELLVQNYLQ